MSTIMRNEHNIEYPSAMESIDEEDIVWDGRNLESAAEVEDFGDEMSKDESKNSDEEEQTYPADCYSFLALHGPFDKGGYFYFGFFVWSFQILFLTLMIMRVISKWSTNEDTDNPEVNSMFSFIPANNPWLSKATQFSALIAYCIFADESLQDIVTAVETFPKFRKATPEDRTMCMAASCILRFIQGMMATFVVLLLVVSTTDVIDLVLNFAAVNFISAFDDVAFELAQTGKYGPILEAEANRIEELPVPACLYQKYKHVRYRCTVLAISMILLAALSTVIILQFSKDRWVTSRLRIQFKDDPVHEKYNGCYDFSEADGVNSVWSKRVLYENFKSNEAQGKFGYCQDDRKWYLYTGNKTNACDIEPIEIVVSSARTYTFDISAVQEEPWYSRTGTPLEWYFFDDNKVNLTDDECESYLGDGVCNDLFNVFDYSFDEGDCCGYTCSGLNCGRGALPTAFNNNVTSGSGFPKCDDPAMVPITIHIKDVYVPPPSVFAPEDDNPFANVEPLEPLLIIDCDGKNYLMVNVKPDMKFQAETINVADGADCQITIKNVTGGPLKINYVTYTIYHGEEDELASNPIVILNEDSQINSIRSFRRIPDCYFTKLGDYIDITTIYTGDDPSNKAVKWLMEDPTDFSECLSEHFVERYALAAINYALPKVVKETDENIGDSMELWIETERQCAWQNIACDDGSVQELDLGAASGVFLTGTIPTEIGILGNLSRVDLGFNAIEGTIPTEIGEWQNLNYFGIEGNNITGTIPTEIGNLNNIEWVFLDQNQLSGSIPTEIGGMTSMSGLFLYITNIIGTIPDEIKAATNLKYFITSGTFLTGPLPTELGSLKNLTYLASSNAFHTGTIPSEFGKLTNLNYFEMGNNTLSGAVPVGLLNNTYINFDIYGNSLSGLTPIDGYEVCSAGGGEVYCNCDADCFFKKNHCECAEAVSCCDAYFATRSPCIVCPSLTVKNPDFYVEEFAVTCQEAFEYVAFSLAEFGTKEGCDSAKMIFPGLGCLCDDGGNPSVMQDSMGI